MIEKELNQGKKNPLPLDVICSHSCIQPSDNLNKFWYKRSVP